MLGMSREELAKKASVAERTISDFEAGRRNPISATLEAIQRALEKAGVMFTPENGDGPGVKLRKKK
jgi:transcriptional regulator with XRE-family HTH domain